MAGIGAGRARCENDGMKARLASKVVVVTGGSSGIGRAVAQRVASEGAVVVIGARRAEVGGLTAQ